MILIDSSNRNQILTFVPLIQDNYSEWHIVSLKFDAADKAEARAIVDTFLETYNETKGFCYIENLQKAVSIMRLGEVENYSEVTNNIEEKLQDKRCRVLAKKMTSNGLKQIQLDLSSKSQTSSSNSALFKAREARDHNVVVVVDDDMFIRKTVCSMLSNNAQTHEIESGEQLVQQYESLNPDVVIMDIHMPGQSGLEIAAKINEADSKAFIVISSSDAVKKNVLTAVQQGAIGFLAKPINKEKLYEYLEQCITFKFDEEL